VYALVDCNSFYCSCERLFRPDLWKRPVGVLSNNDGCFVSRTKELKALGVKMGEPYFKVRDLCEKNKVAVFSANFSLYTNMSDRVMSTLAQFTPELEIYSVDEAFLNLSGLEHRGPESYGRLIKKMVERHTGIPVSVGIAPTKTLAKIANHLAKKNDSTGGVVYLPDERTQNEALSKVAVEDIWGIGKRNSVKLRMLNIKTAKDFKDYKNDKQIQNIFTKVGRMTQDELRGRVCFKLSLVPSKKKEIISSRTFGQAVYDIKDLREAVANYASLACEKLRHQESVCSMIEVYVRTNPFKEVAQYHASESFKMGAHTADTRKVIKYAWEVLDKLYQHGYEYKKAMVRISGITDKNCGQLSLFEAGDSKESDKLMEVIDKINDKDGPGTLKFAACGVNNLAWKMQQSLKSPRYVSSWSEIPSVN